MVFLQKRTIDNFKNKKDVRSSTVGFIAKDEWISGIIYNAMVCANDAYFKYDLTHFDGNVQATWYKGEKKDHYTWHTDNGGNTMRESMVFYMNVNYHALSF